MEMSRSENSRTSQKALLLICEGEKTEPNFYYPLIEDKTVCRFEGSYDIIPKPSLQKEDVEVNSSRGARLRPRRKIKGTKEDVEDSFFPGPQPLNWVQAGVDSLDTYDEVWCVFDKDDHPKRKEAFDLVKKTQEKGGKLYIAFSSRCIEYYFILHFEYLYYAFAKSECDGKEKGKTIYYHCLLPDADTEYSCDGSKCVNGYARKQGYWKESKKDQSLYPLLKDKLYTGIINAELIRRESYNDDTDAPIYDRNPFVTTDFLTARLMGKTLLLIGDSICQKADSTHLRISRKSNSNLIIENIGTVSFSLQNNHLEKVNPNNGQVIERMGGSAIIPPNESLSLSLEGTPGDLFQFCIRGKEYLMVY